MQTFEALFSLLFLILIASLLIPESTARLDTGLQQAHVSNDVWRVLYLKGDFKDFSFDSGNPAKAKTENHLADIYRLTKFCVFISGERVTAFDELDSCRGENTKTVFTTHKTIIAGGVPKDVAFSTAIKQ